jgi:hypothetical protein
MGYASNSLSAYFHNIGWRSRLLHTLREWFPGQQKLELGGNYGLLPPVDLPLSFLPVDEQGSICNVANDTTPPLFNSLSPLAHVELLRRLVMHSDIPAASKFPGLTERDHLNILYGADASRLFPGLQWGGMSTDITILLQSALDMNRVQQESHGRFRIFSKSGAGFSTSRRVGEILSSAYACLPVLDPAGQPVTDLGLEFLLHIRGSVPGDTHLSVVEAQVHRDIGKVVQYLRSL